MNSRNGFAIALKKVRKARGLSQEDFSEVSSRTYISSLERGIKSPTLDKIVALSNVLEIHPVTLILLSQIDKQSPEEILDFVRAQIKSLES